MPVITVHGIPCATTLLGKLRRGICDAVAGIPELHLTPEQTTVRFPGDLLPPDRVELSVIIEGLFQHFERLPPVRQRLAEAVKTVVVNFAAERIKDCKKVEVLINVPFDVTNGYAEWTPSA